jgi:hypothetical protein
MIELRAAARAFAIVIAVAAPAAAQTPTIADGAWELSAGASWWFGGDLGSSTAMLERPNGEPFELFKTETSMDGGPGVRAALAWAATGRLAIEATFSYARPGISTRVTADAEDAGSTTSSIRLHQYLVEGSARWYPARRAGRFHPYLRAGAGYLRQLDTDHAHVETGTLVHLGAGLDRLLRERADAKVERMGLRLDARVTGRSGGFDVKNAFRIGGTVGAAIFFGF